NQQRTFLSLLAQVLPHVPTDAALPRRIKSLVGQNRAFGGRDRRLYRELLYTAIRFLPWISAALKQDANRAAQLVAWLAPTTKDTESYRAAALADWPALPATLVEKAVIASAMIQRGGANPQSGKEAT